MANTSLPKISEEPALALSRNELLKLEYIVDTVIGFSDFVGMNNDLTCLNYAMGPPDAG